MGPHKGRVIVEDYGRRGFKVELHKSNCACTVCSLSTINASLDGRLAGVLKANRDPQAAARKKSLRKTVATIKMGDKLFVVTRRDISPGYQGVQSQHALRQFTHDHPARDAEWFTTSNFLAWCSVEDEQELMRLIVAAGDLGLKWSAWREPDVGGAITAIAIEPHPKTVTLCKGLPLALKELST
jgi:hypothetical protein